MARQMKDSGIPYLGTIPASWGVQKLRYSVRWKSEKGYPDAEVLALYRDYGVIPKSSRDDNHNVTSLDTSTYKYVEVGDFVINKMKAWQGSMGVSPYSGIISPAYHVCAITNEDIHSPYFHYLLRNVAYLPEFARLSTGLRIGQWDLSFDDFRNLPFLLPDKPEQERIAAILDTKCAEIDKVVEQTRATIEEYKKLKQAIITEAVTKGVRGLRPMKPSGVEWIGDIPEEWRVGRIKDFAQLQTGATPSTSCPHYFNGEIPWFTPGDFSESFEVTVSQRTLSKQAEDEKQAVILPPLTPLLVGIGASAGKVSFSQVKCSCNQQVTALIECSANPKLLTYILEAGRVYLRDTAAFTTLPIINNQTLGYFKIAVPTCVAEQQEIAAYLDTKCAEIDRIIEKKEQLIEELGSYKKSLIYEYVTGKREIKIHNYSQGAIC